MTISCSKCGHSITSVILDKELAWKECFERLGKHVQRQHHLVFQAIQTGIQKVMIAVAVNMMQEECAVIPEEEGFILQHLDGLQQLIMMAAGFDPEEVEETVEVCEHGKNENEECLECDKEEKECQELKEEVVVAPVILEMKTPSN